MSSGGTADRTPRYDTVTLVTDYGTVDEFVGILHSVIRQLAPLASVIDLTHGVRPFDVSGGALTLARSVQYLCPGVVVAIVDPGVGTPRRPVAIEVSGGDTVLVGPDNGLLAGAAGMMGGAERAVVLDNPAYHLPTPGRTFDGRDIFAPAAAHLCRGVEFAALGTPAALHSLTPAMLPLSHEENGELFTQVLWVDHYGNVQLNVDPDDVTDWGDRVELRIGDRRRPARRVTTFAEVTVGEVGLIVDSYGLLAVVVDRLPAAEELGVGAGDEIRLARLDPPDAITTAVTLGSPTDRSAR